MEIKRSIIVLHEWFVEINNKTRVMELHSQFMDPIIDWWNSIIKCCSSIVRKFWRSTIISTLDFSRSNYGAPLINSRWSMIVLRQSVSQLWTFIHVLWSFKIIIDPYCWLRNPFSVFTEIYYCFINLIIDSCCCKNRFVIVDSSAVIIHVAQ